MNNNVASSSPWELLGQWGTYRRQTSRERLIAEYNRKPSIYGDNKHQFAQNCLNIGNLTAQAIAQMLKQLNDTGGVNVDCEANLPNKGNVSLLKLFHRVMCLTGAGFGIVGLGLVSVFGIVAAAASACTVVICNKHTTGNEQHNQELLVPNYMPSAATTYYYQAPGVVTPAQVMPNVQFI